MSVPAGTIPSSSLPLQIEAVVKRFGKVTAVDGITLELRSSECLGLLGPNGAGRGMMAADSQQIPYPQKRSWQQHE